MGAAAATAVAPKFIFDCGKNLHLLDKPIINMAYLEACYEEILFASSQSAIIPTYFAYTPYFFDVSTNEPLERISLLYPKRFNQDENGDLVEVLPFKT